MRLFETPSVPTQEAESLKESLEDGISAAFRDLINQENDLLNQYESAQVTLEDKGENRFADVFDYIRDDINIHIGMLQAALEDVNPPTEKIEDGKEQGIDMLDESLFEGMSDNKLYAYLVHSTVTDTTFAIISDSREKLTNEIEDEFTRDFVLKDWSGAEDQIDDKFKYFVDKGFILAHNCDATFPWQKISHVDYDAAEAQNLSVPGWYFNDSIPLEVAGQISGPF